MTVKEKLEQKIAELEAVKENLEKLEKYRDPNNNDPIYSQKSITDITETMGITPKNVGYILEKLVVKINEYVDYISNLDGMVMSAAERDSVLRDGKIVEDSIQFSDDNYELSFSGTQFSALIDYLPDSDFIHNVDSVKITSSPVFREDAIDGNNVECEFVIIRMNNRLNIQDYYSTSIGLIDYQISGTNIFGDDIFIVGIKPSGKINNQKLYYIDFTYKVEVKLIDGTVHEKIYSIGNTVIGQTIPNFDNSEDGIMIVSDFLEINRFEFKLETSYGSSSTVGAGIDYPIGSGTSASNYMTEITVGDIPKSLSNYFISYRDGCSYYRSFYETTYSMYLRKVSTRSKIVFSNLKPIDEVFYETIRGI